MFGSCLRMLAVILVSDLFSCFQIKGQLNISTGEFQSLTRQLEQVTMVMGVLDKLTKAQQLMENISMATSKGKYSEASSSLIVLEEAFKQSTCEREEEVGCEGGLGRTRKIGVGM